MNSSNEQLQEKKLYLENELKKLNVELTEVLNLNDNLVIENREKDDAIEKREQQLLELKDKNSQDIEQLRTERLCLVDSFDHNVEVISDCIKRIRLQRDRYLELEEENAVIRAAIEKLKEKMSKDSDFHAHEMHTTNAGMRQMRQQMEATFRKELMEMDLAFQQHAFTAMEDQKKRAMLANSKLKDELALQSVGISNLSVRCGRDKQNCKTVNGEMKKVGEKVKAMRMKLSAHQARKVDLLDRIRHYSMELHEIQSKEKQMLEEVMVWPDSGCTATAYDAIAALHQEELQDFRNWADKLHALCYLQADAKLMTAFGDGMSRGSFNDRPTQCERSTVEDGSSRLHRLMDRIAGSPYLDSTLSPLMGKESALLSSEGVTSCIEQLLGILENVDCPDDVSASVGSSMTQALDGSSSSFAYPTRGALPYHIDLVVRKARTAIKFGTTHDISRRLVDSGMLLDHSGASTESNLVEVHRAWIKTQPDSLQSYRNLTSMPDISSRKNTQRSCFSQLDPPTQSRAIIGHEMPRTCTIPKTGQRKPKHSQQYHHGRGRNGAVSSDPLLGSISARLKPSGQSQSQPLLGRSAKDSNLRRHPSQPSSTFR